MTLWPVSSRSGNSTFCQEVKSRTARFDVDSFARQNLDFIEQCPPYAVRRQPITKSVKSIRTVPLTSFVSQTDPKAFFHSAADFTQSTRQYTELYGNGTEVCDGSKFLKEMPDKARKKLF